MRDCARRSLGEQPREWDFTVHKELMFREVAEPEMGTEEERARVCVPFPFELSLPNGEAGLDFEVHVEGWKNFAYYSPGARWPPDQAAWHACSALHGGCISDASGSSCMHAMQRG
jgi:hypothetical protein